MAIKNYKEVLNKVAQRVDIKDRKIFERGVLPSYFGRGVTDTIEFVLYDQGDNQLPQGEEGKMVRYINISEIENIRKYILIAREQASNKPAEYFVDIERLINEAGYSNGLFRTQVTLLNKRVGSEHNQNKVWIHEISPSRTEIRVLPIKATDERLVNDLNERYNILLENGDFRDDIINRLDGFTNSLNAITVKERLRALFGEDYINQIKREFKIDNFDLFIKDVVDKAREAINYFVTNREFNIRSNNYGKPLSNNVFEFKGKRKQNRRGKKRKASAQRLDVRRLIRKSNKIVCDVIDYYLPLRNLQVKSLPTMELLESRDKVKKILQKFNSSKSIDTKVTQRRRIVKPQSLVSAAAVYNPPAPLPKPKKEKPIPSPPVKVTTPPICYYYYAVTNVSAPDTAVVKYKNMGGEPISFNIPTGKNVKICAEEGTVKASISGVTIVKKELCMENTPVPKFIIPKTTVPELPPLIDLDKIQEEVRRNLEKMDFTKIKFDLPEIKLPPIFTPAFPKINIGPIYAPGATGDAGAVQNFKQSLPVVPPPPIRTKFQVPPINLNALKNLGTIKLPPPPRLPRSGGGVSAGPDYGNPFANSGIMGSGRIQNRFTPGNTFSGYRKGG